LKRSNFESLEDILISVTTVLKGLNRK
jgi:hypothetical protein